MNCGATLTGIYCSECGQRSVDLAAPTWHVMKDAVTDAIDFDSRAVRTARALGSPGRLTIDFLRGRRAPYVGPLKLFLLAGTVLTTTWIATRGVDARYYGLEAYASAGAYIDRVVRGSIAAAVAIAGSSWVMSPRRRFLDDVVFSVHLVAALTLWGAGVIWVGTAWKAVWGTVAATPRQLPSLPFILFLPAGILGLAYIAVSVSRVYGGRWWATLMRSLVIAAIGAAAVFGAITRG